MANREIRPWQAFSIQHQTPHFALQQRLRWEARFLGLGHGTPLHFAFRLRYALSLLRPLGKGWALKAGDEVMVQWGEGIRQAFDQNRLWGGAGFTFDRKRANAELLYLWQYQESANSNARYDRDVVRLTLTRYFGHP